MKNWKIIFDSPNAISGEVFVDGEKLSNVQAIFINAEVGELVHLTVRFIPELLEIEGVSDETNPIKYLKGE